MGWDGVGWEFVIPRGDENGREITRETIRETCRETSRQNYDSPVKTSRQTIIVRTLNGRHIERFVAFSYHHHNIFTVFACIMCDSEIQGYTNDNTPVHTRMFSNFIPEYKQQERMACTIQLYLYHVCIVHTPGGPVGSLENLQTAVVPFFL